MYGALLIAFLSVLGGMVAFLGDRVGMRVGRRRITLFGLRPKYTSILITIITGIVIVTATIAVLAVVSKDVRTALFEMKRLQSDLNNTRTELRRTEAHARDLTNQVKTKESEYQELVSRYQETQNKLTRATSRMALVEGQLKSVSARLSGVSEEYREARAKLAATQASLSEAETNLRFSQSRLAPLTAIQSQLTAVVEQLTKEKERLNREVEALTNETISLKEGLEGMLERRMVFHAGEIILASVIDCGRPANEIRQELLTVQLKQANDTALSRGAQVPGSRTDALRLRPVDLEETINRLAGYKGKAVLRVLSSTNSVAQEPVLVTLQVLPDELIFQSGQVIAETSIEADSDPNTIMQRILALLEEVNWQAIQKGMVSDQHGTVGEVSTWQEVEQAISRIRQSGKTSLVQALAESDTWRAQGPLRVRLVVTPMP